MESKSKMTIEDKIESISSSYSIVDDMKRIKAGLTLFDVMQREDQQELLQKELKKRKQKWIAKLAETNAVSFQKVSLNQRAKGKPDIPPLLITLRIYGKKHI